MKKLILCLLLLSFSSFSHAACKLPKNEKITIGCTVDCGFFTEARLKVLGMSLGYKVEFKNLSLGAISSEAISSVDAILIPGGDDINPKYYLRNVTPELREYTQNNLHLAKLTESGKKRDLFEYSFLKLFLSFGRKYSKMPLLGICRGMQMMSVAQGIPLYLDIKTELGIPNRVNKYDKIHVTEDESLMSSLYKDKKLRGVELHHQGIRVDYYLAHKNEYPNVNVTAYSNKGLVAEAIEYKNFTALGVQYHPEKSFPTTSYPVFKWYLTKACEYKTSSKDLE